jgi:hypothetical protein
MPNAGTGTPGRILKDRDSGTAKVRTLPPHQQGGCSILQVAGIHAIEPRVRIQMAGTTVSFDSRESPGWSLNQRFAARFTEGEHMEDRVHKSESTTRTGADSDAKRYQSVPGHERGPWPCVVVHIDDILGSQRQQEVQQCLKGKTAVIRAYFSPTRPHLLLVEYNGQQISSYEILQLVIAQNVTAQLIGPV